MQRADAIQADLLPDLRHDRVDAAARADVIARGEQVAGIEAQADPGVPAARIEQARELLDGPPERSAGSGGVLEVQLASLALGERLAYALARAGDRGGGIRLLRGPG